MAAWSSMRLGEHPQAEVAAELDVVRTIIAPRVLVHAEDEGLVDLELARPAAAQVGQRGVAGAEVVERERDAQLVERPASDLARAHRVGIIERLGDLQLEHRRAGIALRRAARRPAAARPTSSRFAGRRGSRRPRASRPVVAASGALARARGRARAGVSGAIRPVCSASGRNSSGREQAELGVLPAHERLDADDLAGRRSIFGW